MIKVVPLLAAMAASGLPVFASDDMDSLAWHWQATFVEQHVNNFQAPFSGPNSLTPDQSRQTSDVTLYAGARLWQNAELWINPEIDQGFGLNDTTGLAGFSSGEAYKVGRASPYLRWQRAVVRQTWNLGGETSDVASAANQFSATSSSDRIVLTIGKFGAGDIFDTNRFAHDPRGDFLNWSVIDTGTFDYAADAWGYTAGAALEWYEGQWVLRAGLFDVSDVPNSPRLEPGFDEYQQVAEVERRYALAGHPGKLAVTAFSTHARMALLSDAIEWGVAHDSPPDPAPVRRARERQGLSLNLEQEIQGSLNVFVRGGVADGDVETYDFTDIDRSLAAGMTIGAAHWASSQDAAGFAFVVNGISALRRQYLAAGGLGVLVGDGQLVHAGNEQITESYYEFCAFNPLQVTLDFQRVQNPAYNRDRGPALIFSLRLHLQI
jgi:high affinity Mn2+ porin